jgi:hypothetical protein
VIFKQDKSNVLLKIKILEELPFMDAPISLGDTTTFTVLKVFLRILRQISCVLQECRNQWESPGAHKGGREILMRYILSLCINKSRHHFS